MTKDIFIKNKQAFCNFCNEPCGKGGTIENENYSLSMFQWWHCDTCKVSFLVSQGAVYELELRTSLNKKLYIAKVFLDLGITEIYLWRDSPSSLVQDELITEIDAILDVTPKTFPNKLKTILTFL